jgi:dTDP-4-dehydrorhamnose reductase
MIHISSGCIFDGVGPFDEEAVPNFCDNVYQRTKLFGEQRVRAACERSWIFRIRMPFGPRVHRRNWLCKLMAYDRILEGHNSVTFIDEFAMRSYQLVQKAEPGIYHAACPKPVYTANVARMLYDAGLREKQVKLFKHDDFMAAGHVQRSAAVLDVSKFEKAYGAPFGDPLVSIRWCIDNLRSAHATSTS